MTRCLAILVSASLVMTSSAAVAGGYNWTRSSGGLSGHTRSGGDHHRSANHDRNGSGRDWNASAFRRHDANHRRDRNGSSGWGGTAAWGYGNGWNNNRWGNGWSAWPQTSLHYGWSSSRYRGGWDGYGYRRYRHKDNDGDVAFGVGLGLLTLGVIAAASSSKTNKDGGDWQNPDTVVVAQAPTQAVPEPAFDPALGSAGGAQSCLQTREYTTTVYIGGKKEEAYGTACLQPDGSWLQGPLHVPPKD